MSLAASLAPSTAVRLLHSDKHFTAPGAQPERAKQHLRVKVLFGFLTVCRCSRWLLLLELKRCTAAELQRKTHCKIFSESMPRFDMLGVSYA